MCCSESDCNYEELVKSISLKHIAFVADGNRRWALQRGLPRFDGHKRGAMVMKDLTVDLMKCGLKYLTFFVFSTENWNRSQEEIDALMDIFRDSFDSFVDVAKKNHVKFVTIGNLEKLPEDIQEKIKRLRIETEEFSRVTVTIAINYGARDEILRAVKRLVADVIDKKVDLDSLTEDSFSNYLDTAGIPYPDIIVRTGEKRISNFLLWQAAYSEIFFVEKYWPDLTEEDMKKIIKEFSLRKRRYGA